MTGSKRWPGRVALALTVLALPACGRVADPLPPVIRIPQQVSDFAVSQHGYTLRFSWTNPSLNVDATPSADLGRAVIRSGEEILIEVAALEPGSPQVVEFDTRDRVGLTGEFSVTIESGAGRSSSRSNRVPFRVVVVPEAVTGLRAVVDQGRIALSWSLPADEAIPVEAIRVYRSGEVIAEIPGSEASFSDLGYVPGETYAYVVSTGRMLAGEFREGVASEVLTVDAVDIAPPGPPANLVLRTLEGQAFLTWEAGTETDLAGYRVFRQEAPGSVFVVLTGELTSATGYTDTSYLPGYAYGVSAVDQFGNEGPRAGPVN